MVFCYKLSRLLSNIHFNKAPWPGKKFQRSKSSFLILSSHCRIYLPRNVNICCRHSAALCKSDPAKKVRFIIKICWLHCTGWHLIGACACEIEHAREYEWIIHIAFKLKLIQQETEGSEKINFCCKVETKDYSNRTSIFVYFCQMTNMPIQYLTSDQQWFTSSNNWTRLSDQVIAFVCIWKGNNNKSRCGEEPSQSWFSCQVSLCILFFFK